MPLTDQSMIKFQASTGTLENSGFFPSDLTTMQASAAASAATIAAATAGTTAQYMRGNGTLATFPTIPSAQVQPDWNAVSGMGQILNRPSLATVATSGVYTDLTSRPTIPTNNNQLTNGAAYVDVAGARTSIALTTTGSGAATYNSSTGALNVPTSGSGTVTSVTAGTGLSGGTFTTTGTVSMPNTGTAGTYNGSVTTDAQGRVTSGTALSINDAPGRSIVTTTTSTGFQVDATRASHVTYDIRMSATASIAGAADVFVYLETAATNSTTAGDWTTVAEVNNGQTYTLAVALQGVCKSTSPLSRYIAGAKYVRIRQAITGTGTAVIAYAQETKY